MNADYSSQPDDLGYPTSAPSAGAPRRNAFIPLTLIAASLIVLVGWDLSVAAQAHANALQLREQQGKMVEQSKKVQTDLEKLARDLIEVGESDSDAKAIVTKYNISVTAPAK